ncbi:hypothetical protein HYV74_02945 [Candidatus Uhrbacteria bacterium]|nr:hypothetical protein [Candidatus Uhrbacteria bacterium]
MTETTPAPETPLLTWTFAEYEQYDRDRRWYAIAIVIAAALLIYAFTTRNFMFAVIVVMLAVVFYLRHTQEPRRMTCTITESGVVLEDRLYPFTELVDFWVVAIEGTRSVLYVHPRKNLRPRIGIPVESVEPEELRRVLRAHLPEREGEEEPTSDVFARILKL